MIRRSKYNVAPAAARTCDGIRFDSKAEMHRYQELLMLQRVGQIQNLELQPEYQLIDPFVSASGVKFRGVRYRGDFRYLEHGRTVLEAVNGARPEVYRIKRHLFIRRYPDVVFREITKARGK